MSRAKSKAKSAAPKEQVPAQDAKPAAKPEPEVPLDLLCDMAWRIVHSRKDHPLNADTWCDAVREAHFLIQLANELRKGIHLSSQPNPYVVDAEKKILSLLTEDEYYGRILTFERGCQLITNTEKKTSAVGLFRRACERGLIPIDQEQLKELEKNGFPLEDIASLRAAFLRIDRLLLRKNRAQEQSR